MPSNEEVSLVDLMQARASTYGMLARLYRVEIDEETLEELQGMRFPTATGNEKVDNGYRHLYNYLRTAWDDSVLELSIDYVKTFIGHGVNGYSAAYPYESVYTSERRLMMQEARAEVLKIYRENNMKRQGWNDCEDHIAVELEFMQRMCLRTVEDLESGEEDAAIAKLVTQRDFTRDHLLNWMPMLVSDIEKFAKTEFYKGVAELSMGYVEEDMALLTELLESVAAA